MNKKTKYGILFLFSFLLVGTVASVSGDWVASMMRVILIDEEGHPASYALSDSGDYVLEVHEEHAHHRMWNHYFNLETGLSTTLNGAVSVNGIDLIFTNVTGFIVGDMIDMRNGSVHVHMYRKIVSISGNNVTIDSGIDFALVDGSAIEQTSFNMAVDGSVTPQVFTMKPRGTENIDITRLLVQMIDGTAMDDGKFGGLSALTNGVHIRRNIDNGSSYQTLAIWRSNKDLKEDMFNVEYSDKAPAGQFGLNGRWTLLESGAILNLDASNDEFMELVVQDDLTGLIDFQVKMQGHFEHG